MFPFSFSRVFHSLAVSQDQHTQNPWTSFLLPRCQNRAPLWRTSVALDPGSAAKMVRWDDNNTTTVKQVNLFWAQAREKIQNGEEGRVWENAMHEILHLECAKHVTLCQNFKICFCLQDCPSNCAFRILSTLEPVKAT